MKNIIGIAGFLLFSNVVIRLLLTADFVLSNSSLVAALDMVRDGITITGTLAIIVLAVIAIRDSGQSA